MRALPAIIVIALLIAGAVFVADRPGAVSLVWQGWRVDTSVTVLVFGVALIAIITACGWSSVGRGSSRTAGGSDGGGAAIAR
jgi:HemY protein